MSAKRAELEASIEREQRELRSAVQDLQTASLQSVSPAHWASRSPYLVVASAFIVGFYLGARR